MYHIKQFIIGQIAVLFKKSGASQYVQIDHVNTDCQSANLFDYKPSIGSVTGSRLQSVLAIWLQFPALHCHLLFKRQDTHKFLYFVFALLH